MADKTDDKEAPGKFSDHGKSAMIFDESVLMMTYDDLTKEEYSLKKTSIIDDIKKYSSKKDDKVFANDFSVTIIVRDKQNSKNDRREIVGECQRVQGLSVSRKMDSMPIGGEVLYEMKVPGNLSYGEVTLSHLYTNSTVFLNWLINAKKDGDNDGTNQGAALLADFEITVGSAGGKTGVVYELRDAFPISWRMGNMDVISNELIEELTSQGGGEIPLEEVKLVYGQLTFPGDEKS